MSSKVRGLLYWVSAWSPVAVGIGVIAMESTAYFGADRTSGPLRMIYQSLFGPISQQRWDAIHHVIRKTGHFIGYGLLGLAWLRAWWMTLPRSIYLKDALLATLGTAVVASSDELHQSFLPNRTGLPSDVLIDCSGAIVMVCLFYFVLRIWAPKRLAGA
jgi:VanZ family protein